MHSSASFLCTVSYTSLSEDLSMSILSYPLHILTLPRIYKMSRDALSPQPCRSQTIINRFQGQDLIHRVSLAGILAISKPAKARSRGLFSRAPIPWPSCPHWFWYFLHLSGVLWSWRSLLAQTKLFPCLQPSAFSPPRLEINIHHENMLPVTLSRSVTQGHFNLTMLWGHNK